MQLAPLAGMWCVDPSTQSLACVLNIWAKMLHHAGLMLRLLRVQLWACELPNAELLFFRHAKWPAFHQCPSLMHLQVCVLLVQARQGPRCFVPKRFLPEKYDYHRAVTSGQVQGAQRGGDIETGDGGQLLSWAGCCCHPEASAQVPVGLLLPPSSSTGCGFEAGAHKPTAIASALQQ